MFISTMIFFPEGRLSPARHILIVMNSGSAFSWMGLVLLLDINVSEVRWVPTFQLRGVPSAKRHQQRSRRLYTELFSSS